MVTMNVLRLPMWVASQPVTRITTIAGICEGVRSTTRDEAGLRMVGPPAFGHVMNIYIEADLESLVPQKDQALYWIATPNAPGVFIALAIGRAVEPASIFNPTVFVGP